MNPSEAKSAQIIIEGNHDQTKKNALNFKIKMGKCIDFAIK